MSATDVAAWVGAVSGIAAILWDFYKWKTAGPRLAVSATPGMKMIVPGSRAEDDGTYLTISVGNHGMAKTTLTTISLATYDSWWSRQRLKSLKSGIIPQPIGKSIPFELEIGGQWVGAVKQNEHIEELLHSGKMWCDVYHSWSRRPAQVRVVPKGQARNNR